MKSSPELYSISLYVPAISCIFIHKDVCGISDCIYLTSIIYQKQIYSNIQYQRVLYPILIIRSSA